MRIGAYNQITKVYGSQQVKKNQTTNTIDTTSTVDQVSFSTLGKDLQTAKTALESVPDVREDKVSALKERIMNGTYQVSAEDFADKLISAYGERTV